jgi:hypothetical protein
LNARGSALQWSTFLPDAQLNALVLDQAGNVFVTGRIAGQSCERKGTLSPQCGDVLVAELSDHGRRLSYLGQFGNSGAGEGRAISIDTRGAWIFVSGITSSPEFAAAGTPSKPRGDGLQSFALASQPCATGAVYSRLLPALQSQMPSEAALGIALNSFAAEFSGTLTTTMFPKDRHERSAALKIAPPCPLSAR